NRSSPLAAAVLRESLVVFSGDGTRCATGLTTVPGILRDAVSAADEPPVQVWDVATGRELFAVPEQLRREHIALSRDGRRLLVPGRRLTVWDVDAKKKVLSIPEG